MISGKSPITNDGCLKLCHRSQEAATKKTLENQDSPADFVDDEDEIKQVEERIYSCSTFQNQQRIHFEEDMLNPLQLM